MNFATAYAAIRGRTRNTLKLYGLSRLDRVLIVLLFISVIAIFFCHEDDFVRSSICASLPCFTSTNAKAWNKIFYDLAIASITSIAFFFLVVWIPAVRRRNRLKQSLARHYKFFRRRCTEIIMLAADGTYNPADIPALLDQGKFKSYFSEQVTPGDVRWNSFLNNMDQFHLGELLFSIASFRDEVVFILNNTDVPVERTFEYLKGLARVTRALEKTTLDYDDKKALSQFLWEMLTGWNFITGYKDRDEIADIIDAI